MTRTGILKTVCFATTALSVLAMETAAQQPRPNILWLTSEDNSTFWVHCYGNPNAETPNIDRLASQGFQYMNVFANAPVCAPSRSTWITGIYALSMGTHPMRSRYDIPHNLIRYYPDYLKDAGYYCGNYRKTDYNIGDRDDTNCWDNLNKPDWNQLKQHQPFFQIINFMESHESRAQGDVEHTRHNPEDTTLRRYHPDIPGIRKNYAKYYDSVQNMDTALGKFLHQMEDAGLADNTIVIYCSDHGGVMPRSKRFLYDSGLHAPLVVRIPEKFKSLWPAQEPGTKIDRLVSFIDMPKTWLTVTGTKVPDQMQGHTFLGPRTEPEAEFHFAFRGRMDERIDNVRAVQDKRFLYVKDYMPLVANGQHLRYLWKMAASQAWDAYNKAGKTDAITGRFFRPKNCSEELYDSVKDPDNVHNLINDPEYDGIAKKMRTALRTWQVSIHDAGLLPESDMARRAEKHHTTIYELVRNPALYNLPAYLDAADLALKADPANLPKLIEAMHSPDSGLRYWGASGCLLLGKKAAPAQETLWTLLTDSSDEVRAVAAWSLLKIGDSKACYDCLTDLLNSNSYAMLSILNMLDWMGPDAKPLLSLVAKLKLEDNAAIMQADLLETHKESSSTDPVPRSGKTTAE